jgi:hypothetical protein
MLVAQKWRVRRSAVLDLVRSSCGVDLQTSMSAEGLAGAIAVLDELKVRGLDASATQAGPGVTFADAD